MRKAAVVEGAIARVDDFLSYLAIPTPLRMSWSSQEDAVLRRWYGRVARPELAQRVNTVLRQRTGNPLLRRTIGAVTNRAAQLGLRAYTGEPDQLCLRAAARTAELPYDALWRAVKAGEMPTVRRGRQRYVAAADFAVWLLSYRARQEAQAEMLEALEGEDLISKQEAMALAGLGETHLTRYLKTGVIRAWKAPTMGRRGRGYWLVERKSVEAFIAARAEGRLAQYLDACPDYVALRRRLGAEVAALRRAGRLAQPDPLTEPKSRYHPGCFTVSQVASHAGLSAQVVYEAISRGRLKAERLISGGRPRYAIAPVEARRYVARLKEGEGHYHNRCRQQIARAGLLTTQDLAGRWRRSIGTIHSYSRLGYRGHILPSRRWGRYLVFDPADVEAFERAANLHRTRSG